MAVNRPGKMLNSAAECADRARIQLRTKSLKKYFIEKKKAVQNRQEIVVF
jgi:hypothetical protein